MQWLMPAIIATFFNTALLSLIYLYLYSREKEKSLLIFCLSWGLYTVRYILMLIHLVRPAPLLLIGNQLSIVFSSQLLLVGFNIWLGRRPWPVGWTLATAAAAVWIIVAGFSEVLFTLYTLPGFFYVGLIYIRMGVLILRSRSRAVVGNRIVAVTLIIWGFHKMDYPFLRPVVWFAPWGYLLGALAAVITAIGVILIYFEETREMLKGSLREKDILMKEIHHRVKNNLTVLHSLIRYQGTQSADTELSNVLKRLEEKIFAFVLIHTTLYKSSSLDELDLKEYLGSLVNHMGESFGLTDGEIRFEYVSDRVTGDINTARNIGLIVNEVVTNSLKYAFPDGGRREIRVSMRDNADDGVLLQIRDNGTGIDSERNTSEPKMSGLYLVRLLSEELDARMNIVSDNGTVVSISLPRLTRDGETAS